MNPKRILIVYSGWLGDLVWIVPALHALKTRFESVSLVVSQVQQPLAEIMTNGLLDAVYVDCPATRQSTARAVRRQARADGTVTFLDLKGRGKTGLYMPWGGNRTVLIPHRRDAREYLLARLLHPRAQCMPRRTDGHMVEAYMSGLRDLGVAHTPISFALPFSQQTMDEAEAIARREGLREVQSVALNPGSAQFSKIWPATHFRRLAEILVHDLGCNVVLMGAGRFAPNEDYDRQVARTHFQDGLVTNLVEETSLAVDAYLLHSGAFTVSVGNDSFANHMAGSASETAPGAPGAVQAANGRWYRAHHTVSLFGPTNPVFCRPYDPTGAFNTVVQPATYPAKCVYDRQTHTCPHYGDRYCADQAHCMQHLTVEQVIAAVARKLARKDARPDKR
jgi:ADP-heptose:LPS heptosyltransferase